MKTAKKFLLLLLIISFTVAIGQEKQKPIKAEAQTENPVRTKIVAKSTFKLPYSVEIFANSELDERNRVVVRGWDIKGKIVSSVGNLAGGAGGGAAAASYAATGRTSNGKVKITISQAETGDEASTFSDEQGNFSLTLAHDTLHTIYVNGVEYGQVKIMKTKHDTVKNSIGNVR